jgi:enoyl-CoA hydratase/carnithine racemase
MGMEANIDAMADMPIEELFASCASLSRLLRKLETLGKPLVAAINGMALGGGYEICLACHHRIAADAPTVMVGLPEAQVGLLPGAGGTQRLPRMIGILAAMPFLMEGKQLQAVKAREAGLVDEVVAPEQLLGAAKAWLLARPTALQPWDVKGFRIPVAARWTRAWPRPSWWATPCCRPRPFTICQRRCAFKAASTKVASCPSTRACASRASTWPRCRAVPWRAA